MKAEWEVNDALRKWLLVLIVFAAAVFYEGLAMANGRLAAAFLYTDSGGATHHLDHAYVYLQAYPKGAPIMEKNFRPAEYVLGPSDASGNISVSVPEGAYRVLIMRRAPLGTTPMDIYDPPRPGDFAWVGAGSVITVTTGSTINLGAVYAQLFSRPVTISGTITGASSGSPVAGWFVKAATVPCEDNHGPLNHCGSSTYSGTPDSSTAPTWAGYAAAGYSPQYPAQQLTDLNGNYTITVPAAGTYYVYACPTPTSCGGRYGREYPGGYITCDAAHVSGYRSLLFYAVCPLAINGTTAGVNIAVPGK